MKIEVKGIAKKYNNNPILKNISFCADGGKCIGILGSNGSGKSTLLSILAGIQKCDAGAFLYDGNDLFRYPKQRSELIGYVPQGTPLIGDLTAYDNLRLWYQKKEIEAGLDGGILSMLGIGDFLKTTVNKMSGGMKKRLSIACALSSNPPIILLDEPTAALDLVCKQSIFDFLKQHKEKGGILVLVTHDALELELCDECYIIKDGENVPFTFDGNIEELVKQL